VGKRGPCGLQVAYELGWSESVRAEQVFAPLHPPRCILVEDGSVFSPPEHPLGSVPVSQLLPAISVAAMPLHCEDTCPGSPLVRLVNAGGEEGRDGLSWLHRPQTLVRKEGSEWENGSRIPPSLCSPRPLQKTSLLISEMLDKLAVIMGTEGELEVRGWQEGLGSSTKKGELFLMQYTDI